MPPDFTDFAALHSGDGGPSEAFLNHCQREFLQAQWKELLDDEFVDAYEHGVVIECCDGITRRFYLRIFAYSADYPEKSVPTGLLVLDLLLTNHNPGFFSAVFGIWGTVHVLGVLFLNIAFIE